MKLEKVLELVDRHGEAEMSGDLDGIMQTLCTHPVYEIYPMNMRVEGTDAVRQMYAGLVATGFFDYDHIATWTNESGVVREDVIHVKVAAGEQVLGLTVDSDKSFDLRVISILTVDEKEELLKGERVLWDGTTMFSNLGIKN